MAAAAIAGDRDWSLLPYDLLVLILRLLPLPDLIRSRSVCSSWLLASKSSSPSSSPILMLAGDESDESSENRTFLFLADPARPYRPRLPQMRGRRCLASADGWLLIVDELAELHLFNPFTLAELPLPSITTLSSVGRFVTRDAPDGRVTGYMLHSIPSEADSVYFHDLKYMLRFFFHRGVIFSEENEKEKGTVVFIIYSVFQDLAFARPGDRCRTELRFPLHSSSFFNDVVFHKGQYYAVQIGGVCIAFDVSSSPPEVTFVGPPNHGGTVNMYHLVESLDGDYLMEIWRHESWVQPDGDYDGVPSKYGLVYKTQAFTVFTLDTSRGTAAQMVKAESLEEGTALFLGNNRSMLLNTRDFPELKENCIYFTDGDTEQYISERHMRRDVGVYYMKDKTVRPLYPHESVLNRLTWPPPIWLTPCFPLNNRAKGKDPAEELEELYLPDDSEANNAIDSLVLLQARQVEAWAEEKGHLHREIAIFEWEKKAMCLSIKSRRRDFQKSINFEN